jgi:hypothetical protein
MFLHDVPDAQLIDRMFDEQNPKTDAEKRDFARPSFARLSDLMEQSVAGTDTDLSVDALIRRLSVRGLAPVILVVALLNIVTIIPGSSTVMGLPLVFLGASLVFGARTLWLPRRLRERRLNRETLARGVARALPYVRRIERMAHPRYWPGGDAILSRVYGALVLCLGLAIMLPIPFGNTMPAVSIVLLSLGFTARDGLWVGAGLIAGAIAVGIVTGFVFAVGLAGLRIFG